MSNGYFYAFADEAAAIAAGAMVAGEDGNVPAHPQAIVLRTDGIELSAAEIDPETEEIVTPASMSAPLVILSPEILPGCSSAVVVPVAHRGFA